MPSTSAKQAKFMRAVAHSPKFAKKVGVSQSVGKDFEMADKKMKKFGDGGAMKKSPMPKEPVTGGPKTVPYTPERKKFLDEMARRNKAARDEAAKMAKKATPYAKGGKTRGMKFGGGGKTMTDEQKRKLAAATAKRGSESRGLDLRQEASAVKKGARNVAGRVLRVGDVGLNTLGGLALTGSGLVGKALGTKDARDLERARGAFKDAAKSAKAVVMGEPKGEDIVSNRVKYRGADADWAKKEGKAKGGKVMKKASKAGRALVKKSADTMGRAMKMNKGGKCYAAGGLVAGHKSADGIAKKGKTKGKEIKMAKGGRMMKGCK